MIINNPKFLNYSHLIIDCDTKNQNYLYFDSSTNAYCQLNTAKALDIHKRLNLESLIKLGGVVKKNHELPVDVLDQLKNRFSVMGARHEQKLQEIYGIFSNIILCKERFVNFFRGKGFYTIRERAAKIFEDIIPSTNGRSPKEEIYSSPQHDDKEITEPKTAKLPENMTLDANDYLLDELFDEEEILREEKKPLDPKKLIAFPIAQKSSSPSAPEDHSANFKTPGIVFAPNGLPSTEDDLIMASKAVFSQRTQFKAVNFSPIGLSFPEVVTEIFNSFSGFCVGEHHNELASKKFLIDHMPLFKRLGVNILFMEQFYDDEQDALDLFLTDPQDILPIELDQNLATGDRHSELKGAYSYKNVLLAAKKEGIRIVGIDNRPASTIQSSDERRQGMNFVSGKIMKDTLKLYPEAKFVALMGSGHLNTSKKQTYPGVSELMECPSLFIRNGDYDALQVNDDLSTGGIAHLSLEIGS